VTHAFTTLGIDKRAARRPIAVDIAIVASSAAGVAHLVAVPSHYTWWPASGAFFAILGVVQLVLAAALLRGWRSHRLVLAALWGTVGVVLLYVASRTVGLPMEPGVPFHGGRWAPGRSIVPDAEKYVGPLDVFTLLAELIFVVSVVGTLPERMKQRATNRLMWIGLALWIIAIIGPV
jgi:steroid 5-alpha reductase family enzyme